MSTVATLPNHEWDEGNVLSYPIISPTSYISSSSLLFSSLDVMQRQMAPSPTLTTSPSDDYEFLDSSANFNDLASDSSEYTSYTCGLLETAATDYLASPYMMLPEYFEEPLAYVEDMIAVSPGVLPSDNISSSPGSQVDGFPSYYDSNRGVSLKGDATDLSMTPEPVLVTAKKVQTKTKPLTRECQCPMCPRAFARKHDLQRHIRVHTGAKPYVCPCCQRSFARTDALRRHFRMEETCRSSPEVQEMKTKRRKGRHLIDR
ncbi:hypothetical protein BGW37DRAFT_493380 [Umbelopsis sp. PMI_123]|nr:hypothetical protein BGW37DRAFT_493380 [Umbelopsis sp. PMI_123]